MSSISTASLTYNVQKIREDMAVKGWLNTDLARQAGVSDMVVSRFLRGERQTARMANRLARALGFSPKRYFVPSKRVA